MSMYMLVHGFEFEPDFEDDQCDTKTKAWRFVERMKYYEKKLEPLVNLYDCVMEEPSDKEKLFRDYEDIKTYRIGIGGRIDAICNLDDKDNYIHTSKELKSELEHALTFIQLTTNILIRMEYWLGK